MTDTSRTADRPLLGIQFEPWYASRQLAALAAELSDHVDIVWLPDQPHAREVYVTLAAIASRADIGIATSVTHPIGRDPLQVARAFGALRELLDPSYPAVLGVGTGGPLPRRLYDSERPLARVQEMITLVRALWSGATVELDEYPQLGSAFGYLAGATANLGFRPGGHVPIVVAGVGQRIMRLAGEVADGIINGSNFPRQSLAAFRSGRYRELSGLDQVAAGRAASTERPFRLTYQINVSVAKERADAREFAKHQMAIILGNRGYLADFELMGFDLDCPREVQRILAAGEGIPAAARAVSDAFVDDFIVAGTADECIERIGDIRHLAEDEGYTDFYLGVPVGPDLPVAVDMLKTAVIPSVWGRR